jgi:hypothetical protein
MNTTVVAWDDFHDGTVDGILVDQKTVYVLISTAAKKSYVALARDVVRARVTEFRQGNIILSAQNYRAVDVTLRHVSFVCDLGDSVDDTAKARNMLEKVRREHLTILEIQPSYGATCMVMARSIDLILRRQMPWGEL